MKLLFWNSSSNAVGKDENLAALDDSVPMTPLPSHAAAFPGLTGPDLSEPDKVKSDSEVLDKRPWTVKRLWIEYVSLDIPRSANRDHFSNEQTFFAWLSLADGMAILGVLIAQVSRIQHVLRPQQENPLRYLVLGKPQAYLCYGTACLILLVGAYRFLRQQNAINRGFAVVGGLEVSSIGVLVGLCTATFFLLLVVVDIANVHP